MVMDGVDSLRDIPKVSFISPSTLIFSTITHRENKYMEQQTAWIPLPTLPASGICGFPAFVFSKNHDFKICTAIYLIFLNFVSNYYEGNVGNTKYMAVQILKS